VIAELNKLAEKSRSRLAPGSPVKADSAARGSEGPRSFAFAFDYRPPEPRPQGGVSWRGRRRTSWKFTDGLFLEVFRDVLEGLPTRRSSRGENLVDAVCMGLVQRPEEIRRCSCCRISYGDKSSSDSDRRPSSAALGRAPGGETSVPDTARFFEATARARPRSTRAKNRGQTRPQ